MELLVTVGILLGVLVMTGLLFSTATRAGRRATASSVVHQQLNALAEAIRDDLENTDPQRGVLGIARVDIRAIDTAGDKEDAYYHRADVLTVLTGRPLRPEYAQRLTPPAELAPMSQVVYGHANFAERDADGRVVGRVRMIDRGERRTGEIPASQWHLARREIGFLSRTDPRAAAGKGPSGLSAWLTAPGFLEGQWVVYGDPWEDATDAATLDQSVKPQIPKGFFRFCYNMYEYYFLHFGSHAYRGDAGGGLLLAEGYWWRPCPTGWERDEDGVTHVIDSFPEAPVLGDPVFDWVVPVNLFYGGPDTRTVVDPRPSAQAAQPAARLGLPACSEFRIEYTYDDPQEILVRPRAVESGEDAEAVPSIPRPIRWWSPEPNQTLVWSGLPVDSVNYGMAPPHHVKNRTDLFRWPRAVRITIKAWDRADRLSRPATRVIVYGWK